MYAICVSSDIFHFHDRSKVELLLSIFISIGHFECHLIDNMYLIRSKVKFGCFTPLINVA